MKTHGNHRKSFHLLMLLAFLLIVVSIVSLVRTFSHYNSLSLTRQDNQLTDMARAADAGMTRVLTLFREELRYVLGRRGFLSAEDEWFETGSTEDLRTRLQENLVTGNPLIRDMLAIREGQVFLTAVDGADYYFPDGMEGSLQPCFGGDGAMYLALIEEGQYARYAALLSVQDWYGELASSYGSSKIHLMLLGRQKRILLHTWQGEQRVNILEDLTRESCDYQAVRRMLEAHTTGHQLSMSYSLSYPGDATVHEMRMTALPLSQCTNGYFIVGLTSDYDEIILPMQAAAWRLIVSGALLVAGVLLLLLTASLLAWQTHARDRELERLRQRNEETSKLLEKTTELAHHQRLQTIGTLTASIAHEFNNLLTPIMGYSILTLEGLPEECGDLADNVSEIYEASRKAKDIISRLNALSRKNEEASMRLLSLKSVAERALQVAVPAQPARVVHRLICDGRDCFVRGNETQLSQLLLNLILNAYHAMEQTGGTLTLTLSSRDGQAIAQVTDEGTGIPPEALPHIFEPFFTTKASGRGTGLGLAIVQQVAQNHQGEISVESIPGQGSTFTVRFPLADSSESVNS